MHEFKGMLNLRAIDATPGCTAALYRYYLFISNNDYSKEFTGAIHL